MNSFHIRQNNEQKDIPDAILAMVIEHGIALQQLASNREELTPWPAIKT